MTVSHDLPPHIDGGESVAPAGTPRDIVAKLNTGIVMALQAPDVREKLQTLGIDPVGSSVDAFSAFVKSEVPKWAKVVRESGATAE